MLYNRRCYKDNVIKRLYFVYNSSLRKIKLLKTFVTDVKCVFLSFSSQTHLILGCAQMISIHYTFLFMAFLCIIPNEPYYFLNMYYFIPFVNEHVFFLVYFLSFEQTNNCKFDCNKINCQKNTIIYK